MTLDPLYSVAVIILHVVTARVRLQGYSLLGEANLCAYELVTNVAMV
jgi:hypothetical protein